MQEGEPGETVEKNTMKCSIAGFVYYMKCFPFAASSKHLEMEEKTRVEGAEKPERKPGGGKSMPYVIGMSLSLSLLSAKLV